MLIVDGKLNKKRIRRGGHRRRDRVCTGKGGKGPGGISEGGDRGTREIIAEGKISKLK